MPSESAKWRETIECHLFNPKSISCSCSCTESEMAWENGIITKWHQHKSSLHLLYVCLCVCYDLDDNDDDSRIIWEWWWWRRRMNDKMSWNWQNFLFKFDAHNDVCVHVCWGCSHSLFLLVVDLIMAKGVLLKSETKYLQTHTHTHLSLQHEWKLC